MHFSPSIFQKVTIFAPLKKWIFLTPNFCPLLISWFWPVNAQVTGHLTERQTSFFVFFDEPSSTHFIFVKNEQTLLFLEHNWFKQMGLKDRWNTTIRAIRWVKQTSLSWFWGLEVMNDFGKIGGWNPRSEKDNIGMEEITWFSIYSILFFIFFNC